MTAWFSGTVALVTTGRPQGRYIYRRSLDMCTKCFRNTGEGLGKCRLYDIGFQALAADPNIAVL